MNRRILLLEFFLAATFFSAFCQSQVPFCGSDLLLNRLDSSSLHKHQQIEQYIYRDFSQGIAERRGAPVLYVLPVAVHIIHNNGAENISDAQVQQAIIYINQAYANVGYYDSLTGVNTQIQFCLAKQDPQGLLSTGITRVQSALTDLDMSTQDLQMKNLSRWNPLCYANIYVVKEICDQGNCGVAGYAYFPSSHGSAIDGLVVEARYFGTTPGYTSVATHELGHYLGLYHTFQGGCTNNNCLVDGDRVCDTPPDQSTAGIACSGSANTCSTDALSGFPSDQPDLNNDYMDYGNIPCFNIFTAGQRDRMLWTIANVRSSLLNCPSCNNPCTLAITALFTPSTVNAIVGSTVTFSNGSTGAATYSWYLNGVLFSSALSPNYTFNTQGTYIIRLKAVGSDVNCISYFNDTIHVICGAQASFTQPTTQVGTGQSITFTNTSTGATSYQWYLDGVLQTTTANFTYTFNQQGTFAVYLIASNGICSDTTSIVNFIHVGPPCNISFTYSQSNPNTYLVLQPDSIEGRDARIFSVVPGSSDGTSADFLAAQWTWQGVPGVVKPLLQFDLSRIPTGSIIHSATLSLYANTTSASGYPGTPMWGTANASYLKRVTSTWSEAGVNWTNQPSTTTTGQVLLPQSISTTQDYTNIDITAFVQYWNQNPSQNYGMLLDMITNNYYNSLIFCSSDHPAATKRPKLVVYYTPPVNTCFPVYFIPDTTCHYSNYYWTFCQPIFNIPAVQSNPVTGVSPAGSKLMKDQNGNYHVFYADYNTASAMVNTVYRQDFGNSINNTPTLHAIHTPSITATYAHGVDVVFDGGNYYGFVIYNNLIYRLDFGTSIVNDTPSVAQVTGYILGNLGWAHKIEVVHETNIWWLLVVARNGSYLSNLYLGNSITNNVQSANYVSCPSCWGFSYQKVNGSHYVFVTAVQSGMRLLSFGNSLANAPTMSAWATYGSGLHGDVSLYQNCDGSFDGIILKENQATHTLIHLDSITATPTIVVNSFSNGVNRSGSASRILRTDAGLTMFAADSYGLKMTKLNFPDCGVAFSTAEFPPPVYYPTPGTYYVRLAVDEGLPTQQVYCDSITVSGIANRPIDLGNDTTICLSQAFTLHAGSGFNSYLWSNAVTDSVNTVYSAGRYWVEARDSCNNISRDTIIITVDSATVITLRDTLICIGNSVTLSAPNGFTSYQWTPANFLSCTNCQTTIASPPDTTAYTVTAYAANGCVNAASAIVNVNTCGGVLNPIPSSTPVTCGGGDNGTASVAVSGGTPLYHYYWSNGDSTATIFNLSAGTYYVTVTDAINNTVIETVIVIEPVALSLSLLADSASCQGVADGSVNSSISGGVPNYQYAWSNGPTSTNLTAVTAGTYTLTVTDNNSCPVSATIIVNAPEVISVTTSITPVSCKDGNNGAIKLNVFGGTPDYNVVWNTGDSTASISALYEGVYSVTITDANGCRKNSSISLIAASSYSVQLMPVNATCTNSANGSVWANILSGSTPPYSYIWSTGDTASLIHVAPGVYSVTVTDSLNCLKSDSASVGMSGLEIDVVVTHVSCPERDDGSIVTTVTGGTQPYYYNWNEGATSSSMLANIPAGIYSLTVTDQFDCSVSDTMIVTVDLTVNNNCLFIYDVFSPNGDGTNEAWVIDGLESFPNNELQIFNRWGSVVFEAKPYLNNWDGNSKKDEPLPSAAYYYILKLNVARQSIFSGNVTLIR